VVEILKYTDRTGRSPFERWLVRLRDEAAQAAVLIRLRRLALGLAGDTKSVGAGVFELRVHIGPGYRVYFAWEGPDQVVLLGGGTKATQAIDLATARQRLVAHRGKVKH
jgi:putative addiction module killer protein